MFIQFIFNVMINYMIEFVYHLPFDFFFSRLFIVPPLLPSFGLTEDFISSLFHQLNWLFTLSFYFIVLMDYIIYSYHSLL